MTLLCECCSSIICNHNWRSWAATWGRLPDFMCHLAGKSLLKECGMSRFSRSQRKTAELPCCCCMWPDLYAHRSQKKLKYCFKRIRSETRLIIKPSLCFMYYRHDLGFVCVYTHTNACTCLCVCVDFILFGRRDSCPFSHCHVSLQHFSPVLWNSLILLVRSPISDQCWISFSCFRFEISFHSESISSWLNT